MACTFDLHENLARRTVGAEDNGVADHALAAHERYFCFPSVAFRHERRQPALRKVDPINFSIGTLQLLAER